MGRFYLGLRVQQLPQVGGLAQKARLENLLGIVACDQNEVRLSG